MKVKVYVQQEGKEIYVHYDGSLSCKDLVILKQKLRDLFGIRSILFVYWKPENEVELSLYGK